MSTKVVAKALNTIPTLDRVLIIGAGLAGPCLALSLANASPPIRSTIYEIRSTPSSAGGSISLGPNGLHVLDRYAGVLPALLASGYAYNRFNAYADDGEKFGEIRVGQADQEVEFADGSKGKGYSALRIMRSKLHDVLMEEIGRKGDMIDVRYGMTLKDVEEDERGVIAHFEDGTKARGDILIGADGVHSKVRQHVLGPSSPDPFYCGVCIVYGFLDADAVTGESTKETESTSTTSSITDDPHQTTSSEFKLPAFMFTPAGIFMAIPHTPSGDKLAWAITKPLPQHASKTRAEWAEMERSGEVARSAIADYEDVKTEPVRTLLDSVNITNTVDKTSSQAGPESGVKIWPTYEIPRLEKWHKGRVGLIGDAAHGLPPNGQGSGLAFEDAAIMTRLLTEKLSSFLITTPHTTSPSSTTSVDFDALLTRFESIRHPRIDSLREKTKTAHSAGKVQTGEWVWWLKTWAFRGFFWWNKGVLEHTKETGYDVDKVDLGV